MDTDLSSAVPGSTGISEQKQASQTKMKKRTKNDRMQPDKKAERAVARPRLPTPTLEEIQKRAYAIYQARGCEEGRELDDWLLAEYALKTELGGQGPSPAE